MSFGTKARAADGGRRCGVELAPVARARSSRDLLIPVLVDHAPTKVFDGQLSQTIDATGPRSLPR